MSNIQDSTKSKTRIVLFSSLTLLFVCVPVILSGSASAKAQDPVKIAMHTLLDSPSVQYIKVQAH